jgi:predicted DCC family thiol-disulfide oxidoreductase YuxK
MIENMDKVVKTPFLLYDSECTLCTRFKQALERMDFDNRLNYIPVGTEEVYHQFPEIDQEESTKVLHFVDENGKVHRGGEIAAALANHFPGVNKVAWLLETEVGQKVSSYFYEKVDQLRKSSIITRSCGSCGGKH